MFKKALILMLFSLNTFSLEFAISKKAPENFRAYEYSKISIEIELKENINVASILPPENEKIIIKPLQNSLTCVEGKNKILKFDFLVLPKVKGNFKLKPFKILYFESENKEEEPKTYEYDFGEMVVKGKYFYKNLIFWYIIGFIILFSLIIFIIFYLRRNYAKRNSKS